MTQAIGPLKTTSGTVLLAKLRVASMPPRIAAQALEDELVDEAAAVVADVDDHPFFANLRQELLHEFVEAGSFHIGQVDVADAAVGGFVDDLRGWC